MLSTDILSNNLEYHCNDNTCKYISYLISPLSDIMLAGFQHKSRLTRERERKNLDFPYSIELMIYLCTFYECFHEYAPAH